MKAKFALVYAATAAAVLALSPVALAGGHLMSTENVDKIRPGVTSAQQLQDLLGTPLRKMHFPARGIDAWEYEYPDYDEMIILSISIGSDGLVREILRLRRSSV